jgi:hypothetical protein
MMDPMPDRHQRRWTPTLRPDKALYQRIQARLHAAGRNMNDEFEKLLRLVDGLSDDEFEAWLLYMDGQEAEPPERPGAES